MARANGRWTWQNAGHRLLINLRCHVRLHDTRRGAFYTGHWFLPVCRYIHDILPLLQSCSLLLIGMIDGLKYIWKCRYCAWFQHFWFLSTLVTHLICWETAALVLARGVVAAAVHRARPHTLQHNTIVGAPLVYCVFKVMSVCVRSCVPQGSLIRLIWIIPWIRDT